MKKLMPVIALALGFAGCAASRASETHWTEQLLAVGELARLQSLKRRRLGGS